MTKTIVLIHGAWLTPLGWEFFKKRYEDAGYTVHAPPWPHEDMPLEQFRATPPRSVATLTVGKIVDHYDHYIRALPEPPIIIGHSYGGLFTQKLPGSRVGRGGRGAGPGADTRRVAGAARAALCAARVSGALRLEPRTDDELQDLLQSHSRRRSPKTSSAPITSATSHRRQGASIGRARSASAPASTAATPSARRC